ncbi:hypothetical protein [Pseudobutyrivibrio sp.]|uniref:hypothetical protein n=1 Tax=Pseudobutyrivibrio sp. TaxID=2014367 RepID=UPI0025FA86AE|nr:hypothetical protein [Pseudobutyrivibrio sp.]MBR5649065.1 hypothetical protein [Pseudobutyrivibrio sp.]
MGTKEKALIEALNIEHYDFNKAEEIIREGVNLNERVESDEEYENVLSKIIDNFRYHGGCIHKPIAGCCACKDYEECKRRGDLRDNINAGIEIRKIIHLFLSNGYDLSLDDGKAGIVLLERVLYTSYDRQEFYTAKELLLAGIDNDARTTDDDETLLGYLTDESYIMWFGCENWYMSLIYETLCQIVEAREKGLPYEGIDLYEKSFGKTIKKIYTSGKTVRTPVIQVYENEIIDFTDKIIIEYEDGYLIIDNYAYAWTSDRIGFDHILDISEYAKEFIERKISDIRIDLEKALRLEIEIDSGWIVSIGSAKDSNNERVGRIWWQKC